VVVVFIVLNGYYFFVSPMKMLTGLIGTVGKLPPTGVNLFQLLLAYPVTYSFSTALFVLVLLLLLLAFYFYTDSLLPLIGVAPFIVFFLSWRNLSVYGLPFVPLILAVAYYHTNEPKAKDMATHKKLIEYASISVIVVSVIALLYVHSYYLQTNQLHINRINTIHYVENGNVTNGLLINVSNEGNRALNASFEISSRDPASYLTVSAYEGYGYVPADSDQSFIVNYQLAGINKDTQLFVLAFANDSVTSAWAKAT
jgi:hypothetical protein